MLKKLVPLAVIAWIATPPTTAASIAYYEGVAQYQAGRYADASATLTKAIGTEPGSALAHYYLANSLVKVGKHERAAEQYRISYMLEPRGSVSGFCRAALQGYNKSLPTADDIKAFRDTVRGAVAIAYATKPTLPAGCDPGSVQQSMNIIAQQLSNERAKLDGVSKARADAAINQSRIQMSQVDQHKESQITELYTPRRHYDPRVMDPNYLKEQEQRIRDQAKDEQDRIRREAAAVAARYQGVANDRQRALVQTAADLQRQMTEPPNGKSGIHLVAQGTDLYVRCYTSVPVTHPLPEVKPAVARIYGSGPAPEPDVHESLPDESSAPVADTARRQVRAKLLN